jgi:hypothetical protein
MVPKQKMKTDTLNEPASEFLKCVFATLDSEGLRYCVERNYEQYPEIISGDVDLVMAAADMKSAMNKIRRVADELDWRLFVQYLSSQATHIGFYRNIYPKRFVLVIELFAGGVWRGQQFLSGQTIVEMRHRHGCTWRPHPVHEAMITLIHHLLYNKRVFEKYRRQIKLCVEDAPELFEAELYRPFGKKLAKSILECVNSNNWSKLERQAAQLRRFFLLRSLCFRPFQSIRRIIDICADSGCKPEGIVISLEAMSSEEVEPLADAIIELAVRWHIFIPPTRKKIVFSSSNASIVGEVKSVIASGGIAVILNREKRSLPAFPLKHTLVHVNVHDNMVYISIGERSTSCPVTRETLAFEVWNVILQYRSDEFLRK